MQLKKWLVLLLVVVVAGCAASTRADKLELQLRAFERAIRWSDFKSAFGVANQAEASVPDFQRLQNFQVTSYDKLGTPQLDKEGRKLVQVVEIRYINIHTMSERVYTDQQIWEYVDKDERWKLSSPFPTFAR